MRPDQAARDQRHRAGLFHCAGIFLILAQAMVVPAQAQEWSQASRPPAVTTVYQQPRPYYDSPKIALGSFLAAPSVLETLAYDDNIFASDRNRTGDLIVTTSENLNIQSQWVSDSMAVHLSHAHDWYTGHATENGNTYRVEGDLLLGVAEGGSLALHAGLIQQPQLRNNAQADRQSRSRPIYNTIPVSLSYRQDWGRWHNQAGVDFTQTAYIAQADANRSATQWRYRDRLSYALTSDVWSFLQISYSTQDWRQDPDRRNFDSLRVVGGLNLQISELVALEIGAGALSQHYDFSGFDDLVTPVVSGQLTWNILPLTTIQASIDRTVSGLETTCASTPTNPACIALPRGTLSSLAGQRGALESFSADIGIQHEFWHDFLGQLRFHFDDDKFEPVDLVNQTYGVDLGARILVNRNLALDVSYQLDIRTANKDILLYNSGPYHANTVSLTLRAAM